MPKFKVSVERIDNYVVEVEAADEDAADVEATRILEEAEDKNTLQEHFDDSDGFRVYEAKKITT